MKIEIKNYEDVGDKKMIGFKCLKDGHPTLFIDRFVPIDNSKTDEEYISAGYEALGRNGKSAIDEIDEWSKTDYEEPEEPEEEVSENVGKYWNPEDGKII